MSQEQTQKDAVSDTRTTGTAGTHNNAHTRLEGDMDQTIKLTSLPFPRKKKEERDTEKTVRQIIKCVSPVESILA